MLLHICGALAGALVGLVIGTGLVALVWDALVGLHLVAENDRAYFVGGQLLGVTAGVAVARLPVALDAHLVASLGCGAIAALVDWHLLRTMRGGEGTIAAILLGACASALASAAVSQIW